MQAKYLLQILRPGKEALYTYWHIIVLIQTAALIMVIGYYTIDSLSPAFSKLAQWKIEGGLLFAATTTMISGGLLPEFLKYLLTTQSRKTPNKIEFLHQLCMWAMLGILVDLFYTFQGKIFGDTPTLLIVIQKAIVDQLLFTPFISLPMIVGWFLLYESKYRMAGWLKSLKLRNITVRVLPLWATSLSYWPVTLLIIYALPQELQFPLFLFANAAYSILMIFIIRSQSDKKADSI